MKKLAVLLFLVTASVRADDFATTIAVLETGDAAAVKASLAQLKAMPAAPRVAYAIGYAERRLAYLPGTSKSDRAALLADAAKRFEEVVRAEPKNAEAHALLGSILGAMIGGSPFRAMELGPASGRAMDRALALQPNNPRVLLLAGISALMKPAEFGGGAEVAEPILQRAASIFAQEPADRPWPNWGRAEVQMWLGRARAILQGRAK